MADPGTLSRREHSHAYVDALNARDYEALAALPFHPEYEFQSVLSSLEGQRYLGVEGMRKWAEGVDALFEGVEVSLVDFHEAADEQDVLVLRLTGTARGSGVPLDVQVGHVSTWRDGRMWRGVAYSNPEDAFEAAGLRE